MDDGGCACGYSSEFACECVVIVFFLFTIVIVIEFMETQEPLRIATFEADDCEIFGIGVAIRCAISLSLGVFVSVRIDRDGYTKLLQVFRLPEMTQIKGNTVLEDFYSRECTWAVNGVNGLAFTDDDYLLVACNEGAVAVVDMTKRKHVGNAFEPSVRKLQDLACSGPMLAVSSHQPGCVHLFQRAASAHPFWTLLRSVGMDCLENPMGLCFSKTGETLAVTDNIMKLVRVFCTATGKLVQDLDALPYFNTPINVWDYEDGWGILSVSFMPGVSLWFYDNDGKLCTRYFWQSLNLGVFCHRHMVFYPGEVTIDVWLTPAGAAMTSMSAMRVAWMTAVARTVARAKSHANV